MAATPNLGLTLPVNGADADAWGTELNTALTAIDSFFGSGVTAAFGTTGVAFVVNAMTQTDSTTAVGTVATAYAHPLKATTFATATNAVTITNGYNCYIAAPVAGSHVTLTNGWALGADSLRVNGTAQANLLGVGMLPVNFMDISASQNSGAKAQIINNSGAAAAYAAFIASNNAGNTILMGNVSNGYTTSGVLTANTGWLQTSSDMAIWSGGVVKFAVNNSTTEVARIDASGNLLVGATSGSQHRFFKTSSSVPAAIIQNSSATTGSVLELDSSTASGTGFTMLSANNAGGQCFQILGNGNVQNTNNSYGAISDQKLKQDIILADSQWNDVKALGQIVKKFHLKSEPSGALQLGLIAQDVQQVSPGLVYSTPDSVKNEDGDYELAGTDTLGVMYSVLYMKAFKALGEALLRIEVLEAKVGT